MGREVWTMGLEFWGLGAGGWALWAVERCAWCGSGLCMVCSPRGGAGVSMHSRCCCSGAS